MPDCIRAASRVAGESWCQPVSLRALLRPLCWLRGHPERRIRVVFRTISRADAQITSADIFEECPRCALTRLVGAGLPVVNGLVSIEGLPFIQPRDRWP